jgi:colicin import membrane protein
MTSANATERRDKQKGLVSTLIFHGLLLLLFAFYGLTHSIPPPEEGMVINFGTTETGLGNRKVNRCKPSENVQEERIEKVPPPPTEAAKPVAEEQVLTQETEEEIYSEKKKKPKRRPKRSVKREEERKRQEQERLQAAQKSRMDECLQKQRQVKAREQEVEKAIPNLEETKVIWMERLAHHTAMYLVVETVGCRSIFLGEKW